MQTAWALPISFNRQTPQSLESLMMPSLICSQSSLANSGTWSSHLTPLHFGHSISQMVSLICSVHSYPICQLIYSLLDLLQNILRLIVKCRVQPARAVFF